jgi:hypothetical protein
MMNNNGVVPERRHTQAGEHQTRPLWLVFANVENTKAAMIFKLRVDLIRYFSITSPISESDLQKTEMR